MLKRYHGFKGDDVNAWAMVTLATTIAAKTVIETGSKLHLDCKVTLFI